MAPRPSEDLRAWWADYRHRDDRFGLLLALLVSAFLISGVDAGSGIRVLAGLFTVGAILAVFAGVGPRREQIHLAALMVLAILSISLLLGFDVRDVGTSIGASAQAILLAVLLVTVLRRILEHATITNRTLLGAMCSYFLIGQVFAWIYFALPGFVDQEVIAPTGEGVPYYYSFVVLTTLGFGDVTPVGSLAQRITVLEALIGQMFLAILVARLVSMYSRPPRRRDSKLRS